MTTNEIASGLVKLCQQGKNNEAIAAYYAPDIKTTETMPELTVSHGLEAVHENAAWWEANMEEHGREITGPFISDDLFAVRFTYDVTDKSNSKRSTLDEIALYRVANGKISEARFLYGTSMMNNCSEETIK